MSRGALFTAVWSRCPEHNTLLEPNETKCDKCKLIERNLSLTPPFDVYCTGPKWGRFETGHTYEVVWIIKDAINKYGTKVSGYCFENEDDSIYEHILDTLDFIPLRYLTADFKDSWLEDVV